MFVTGQECVVCGKPKFLFEHGHHWDYPLFCRKKCAEEYLEERPKTGGTLNAYHHEEFGHYTWSLGYENPDEH